MTKEKPRFWCTKAVRVSGSDTANIIDNAINDALNEMTGRALQNVNLVSVSYAPVTLENGAGFVYVTVIGEPIEDEAAMKQIGRYSLRVREMARMAMDQQIEKLTR